MVLQCICVTYATTVEENVMYEMLRIIAVKVDHMYTVMIKNRKGVG